ncbi:MAG: hypothetical protein KJN61_02080 [Gammaproteobacteria bacterium]|nr:hypothetical protein [Gammaproteobacteria bacterium]MBT8075233.1 hypothetical protein [Gammaproteobacteria bacterium]NNL00547.1 hypothetical protein [Xanthomonadales bacterium]
MIQDKFIPGRYINLPTALTGQVNPPAGTNDGDFVEMTSKPLRLEQSTRNPGLGGRYSGVSEGVATKIHRNFQYLRYIVYRTTYMNMSGVDVLTGFMQGCRVVVYSDRGRKFIAHIGTGSDAARSTSTKNTWNAFARMPGVQLLAGFNPWAQWNNNLPQAQPGDHFTGVKCIALVTPSLDLYSVALFKHEQNMEAFRVHDIVKMQSMTINELRDI